MNHPSAFEVREDYPVVEVVPDCAAVGFLQNPCPKAKVQRQLPLIKQVLPQPTIDDCPSAISTFTEWGMIIFVALLLGFMPTPSFGTERASALACRTTEETEQARLFCGAVMRNRVIALSRLT